MKTVYHSTPNNRTRWLFALILLAVSVALVVVFILNIPHVDEKPGPLYGLLVLAVVSYWLGYFLVRRLNTCTVDDGKRTVLFSENRKHPVRIDNIESITYCMTKRGRLKYLSIYERGVQYVDVILDREHADHIVEHLRQLNPAIKLAERRGD